MTERSLKYRAGLFLVGLHMTILLVSIIFRFTQAFDTADFTTILAVIVPIFSSYTAGVIAFIVKDRNTKEDTTQSVTNAFASLVFLAPAFLGCIVLAAIVLQAYRLAFSNFEDFKTFIIAIESALGIYVNVLVFAIFDKTKSK